MTMHRKLSPWLVAVKEQLARPTREGHHSELYSLGMDAVVLFDQLEDDPDALRDVTAVLRQVREGVGVGRATFEEHCTQILPPNVRRYNNLILHC
jgi:hypothetical protein